MRRGAVTCGLVTSQHGATALVWMAQAGHKDTVEQLLDRGADLEARDRVSAAGVCLLRDGPRRASRPSGRCADGAVGASCCCGGPAWEAALAGRDVSRGAMVRQGTTECAHVTSQYGATALVAAARRGHKAMAELLLDRGADLEAKDRVSPACVCCCATGRGGCHRWVQWPGEGMTRRGVVLLSRAGVQSSAGRVGCR